MLKVTSLRPAASSAIVNVPRGRLPAGTHSVRLCLGIEGISTRVFPRARTFDVRCPGYAVHDVLLPDIVARPFVSSPSLFSTFIAALSSLFLPVHSQKTGSRQQLLKEPWLPDHRVSSENGVDRGQRESTNSISGLGILRTRHNRCRFNFSFFSIF